MRAVKGESLVLVEPSRHPRSLELPQQNKADNRARKYCLDHRTEDAHACPSKGAWARARRERSDANNSSAAARPTILNHEKQCSSPTCKTLIDTPLTPGIHCAKCSRDYCLKHRLAEDHECDKIPRPKASDGGVASALGKLRAWGAQKRAAAAASSTSSKTASTTQKSAAVNVTAPLSRSDTATSTLEQTQPTLHRIISPFRSRKPTAPGAGLTTHIAQLKRSAKGDAKVPPAQRVYVHLEAVAAGEGASGARVPRADAWFARDASVGRVLDAAARTLQVANVNNRGGGEEEKLRVFSVERGRLLAFSEKLGEGVKDGDTLVLLRGVGAPDAP